MDTTDQQYFDCLCRTCMSKVDVSSFGSTTPQHEWRSIFDNVEECGALQIKEILSEAVPQSHIQLFDELPKKICCKCLEQLLNVYRFQQMCLHSEEQLQELISTTRRDVKIWKIELTMEDEVGTTDGGSLPLTSFHSIQEPLLEAPAEIVKPEPDSSEVDHLKNMDQLLQQFKDTHGELSEFIKNEPIEDDEPNIGYSDTDTMQSTSSVANDELLSRESEDQQLNETLERKANSKDYCHACDICGKMYTARSCLLRHLRIHHQITTTKHHHCDICDKSFSSSATLKKHVHTHPGERLHSCQMCGQSFVELENLEKHIRVHFEDKPYECPYCPLKFRSRKDEFKHQKTHEEIKRSECDICGKMVRKSNLKKHKRIHSGEKSHKCECCEMRFMSTGNLRRHMRTHTGEKPFKCKYCELAFGRRCIMVQHLRTHLGNKVHRCEFCPSAFPLVSELRLHITTHKNEDPETRERNMKALKEAEAKLQLKLSNKETPEDDSQHQLETKTTDILRRNLKSNRLSPEEDKPYECPYCPLRFSSNRNIARHRAIHEGVKREECDICGKSIRKSVLKNHKLLHSGEKPHKCDFCEKRFTHIQQLRIHIRKHTGEKPYKCKHCECAFSRAWDRTKHLHTHFGANIYRCEFCPLGFPSVSEMRLHFVTHKNEDPEARARNMKALMEQKAKLGLNLSKT